MRLQVVWTIFREEIIETLRDRRTLIMMVGVPLLLYPLMIIAMSKLQESQEEAREARASKIALWGDVPDGLRSGLRKDATLSLGDWQGIPVDLRRDLEADRLRPSGTSSNNEKSSDIAKGKKNPQIASRQYRT